MSELSSRRLLRSRSDRRIAGVCGGLGRHLDIDPTWIRLAFAALFVTTGTGLLFYIILWVVMPLEAATTDARAIESADSPAVALPTVPTAAFTAHEVDAWNLSPAGVSPSGDQSQTAASERPVEAGSGDTYR